ncbi:hypothetical protein EDB19DRAFT_1758180 [Suillus lakei]|nr:hypothetical protein EDB19DRAFT_1758180 [Suillus lakei]
MTLHMMLTRRAVHQSSILLRTMSSKAYVVPVDPKNPAGHPAPGVNPAALWFSLLQAQKPAKVDMSLLFYGIPVFDVTSFVSLGEGFHSKAGDVRREIVCKAVGSDVESAKGLGDGVSEAVIDTSTDPQAATIAAHLVLYNFSLKTSPPSAFDPRGTAGVPKKLGISMNASSADWDRGVVYVNVQNLARTATL